MGRSTKLKNVGGKLVSAKSKTGDPGCALAASLLSLGTNTPASNKKLGECRSKARKLGGAGKQRLAGNEAKAQHMEHIANSGAPVTLKDRLAKANALRAGRTATAKPVATTKEHWHNGDQIKYTGKTQTLHGGVFHEFAYVDGHRAGQKGVNAGPSGKLELTPKPSQVSTIGRKVKATREPKAKPEPAKVDPVAFETKRAQIQHRRVVADARLGRLGAKSINQRTDMIVNRADKAQSLRSARNATAKPMGVAKPSLREQADKHRAGKGTRATRLESLVSRSSDSTNRAYESGTFGGGNKERMYTRDAVTTKLRGSLENERLASARRAAKQQGLRTPKTAIAKARNASRNY